MGAIYEPKSHSEQAADHDANQNAAPQRAAMPVPVPVPPAGWFHGLHGQLL
jgi:hypothetical protein